MAEPPSLAGPPRVITTNKRSRGKGPGWLVVRLLGGVTAVPLHTIPSNNRLPCYGADCLHCKAQLPRAEVPLAPVLYLLENEDPDDEEERWERAALMLNPNSVASVGEFRRGRVLRIHKLSKRKLVFRDDPVPPGPFDVPSFDVTGSFVQRATERGGLPNTKRLLKSPEVSFSPGEPVPLYGWFSAIHQDDHVPQFLVFCLKGDRFPSCRECGTGVRFRFLKDVLLARAHPLFAEPAQGGSA